MKAPVRPRDAGVRFNITPLIDICFNLIVFFALASLCLRTETATKVTLPFAKRIDSADAMSPRRVSITVDAQGQTVVAGEQLGRAEIERLLAERCARLGNEFEVRVRADRAVPYSRIKPILVSCARLGVHDLKFAVNAN